MPRKRKAARAFRRQLTVSAAIMRKRYADVGERFMLSLPSRFFQALSTAAERRAFAEAWPTEFYELFGFFADPSDEWPASTMYQFRGIFRRPAEAFLRMLEANPPRLAFEPPDVSGLHFFPEQPAALALARGRWWAANGLPMTTAEHEWLAERGIHGRHFDGTDHGTRAHRPTPRGNAREGAPTGDASTEDDRGIDEGAQRRDGVDKLN